MENEKKKEYEVQEALIIQDEQVKLEPEEENKGLGYEIVIGSEEC